MHDATSPRGLDGDAYLERIGYRGARTPSRSVPDALHLAHVYILRNQEFTRDRGDLVRTTVIADEQLLGLLAERFGLHSPAGTIFRRHAADDSGPHKTP